MRVPIQQDRNRVINRIARLLETVNSKLVSVASNVVGTSGMAMLRLLAGGVRDLERLAGCARGQMRIKVPAAGGGVGRPARCTFPLDAFRVVAQAGPAG
jgi:hypothetical protein